MRVCEAPERWRFARTFRVLPDAAIGKSVRVTRRATDPPRRSHRRFGRDEQLLAADPFRCVRRFENFDARDLRRLAAFHVEHVDAEVERRVDVKLRAIGTEPNGPRMLADIDYPRLLDLAVVVV